MSDMNAMDDIPYEANSYYIFDRGYFDLRRLYNINCIHSRFVIRQKGYLQYEVIDGNELLDGDDNILQDQIIRLTGTKTKQKYPAELRRIVYYSSELKRTFTYISNSFDISAKQIALLYKNRWQVELFFKWIKQHLHIKSFWGNTENSVRIQIYSAIISYCLVAITEHDFQLNRSTFDVLQILGKSLFDKTPIRELFECPHSSCDPTNEVSIQLSLNF